MTVQQSKATTDVLRVKGLKVDFHTYAGDVKALDGVELTVKKGELLGLVGESGCGKSVTALSIMGLLPPNAEVLGGEVRLDGVDLLKMSKEEIRKVRLKDVAIVFQDPLSYLNPVLTIGSQIEEIIDSQPDLFTSAILKNRLEEIAASHSDKGGADLTGEKERLRSVSEGKVTLSGQERRRLTRSYILSIMREVRLPEPEKVFKSFPFELSGGMRQRVMISMALVKRPKLLLADEMTTALDVTVQAQILQLIRELRSEIDASVVLITHDLAVVAEVCDRVAVMYAGNIVEVAEVSELFKNPLHPYTQGLLASVPRVDSSAIEYPSIKGSVPNLIFPPTGCRFHPRCSKAFDKCPQVKPPLVEVKPGHLVACLLYGE
ncbi:MAG: ABC transporter ATP-binding protein [Thaumarchaeota archaeon]|nr:ABC transporter ATP-binding protein [Nitrososphaerota archaeon]